MIIVYTTFPNKQKAIEVCKKLLEERLIACFNGFEISSGYWWQNKIVDDTEYSVILKTSKFKEQDLFKKLKELHPYTTPAILSIEVKTVDKDYQQWLEKNLEEDIES